MAHRGNVGSWPPQFNPNPLAGERRGREAMSSAADLARPKLLLLDAAPLPRMPRGNSAAKLRHPRIHLRHLLGVAGVEHGGALHRPFGAVAVGSLGRIARPAP